MAAPKNTFKEQIKNGPGTDRPLAGSGELLHRRTAGRCRIRLAADRCGTRAQRPADHPWSAAGRGALSGHSDCASAMAGSCTYQAAAGLRRTDHSGADGGDRRAGRSGCGRHSLPAARASVVSAAHWRVPAAFNRTPEYLQTANDEICVLVQVETPKGVENLDEIINTEGVDGVFIGPSDLSCLHGHIGNPAHPEVQATIEDAIQRIVAAGKAAGILIADRKLAHDVISSWGRSSWQWVRIRRC